MSMPWEQEISELLQEAENTPVRFDVQQEQTNAKKQTARTNIGIGASASNISGDDYKITLW